MSNTIFLPDRAKEKNRKRNASYFITEDLTEQLVAELEKELPAFQAQLLAEKSS